MIELAQPLVLIIALPLLYLWWRLARGPSEVWPLRVCMILLCVLMASSPVCSTGKSSRHLVLLVDRSLSCGEEAVSAAEEYAALLGEEMAPEDRLTFVGFGTGASALSGTGRLRDRMGGAFEDASDLSSGLSLAHALLSGREGGRVFAITDGFYTGPDPAERIPALKKEGLALDFAPIVAEVAADAAITAVHVPERVQQGYPFEISFLVHSPLSGSALMQVSREGSVTEKPINLSPGDNRFFFSDSAAAPGLIRYTLSVEVEGDGRPENNRALAVTQAVGPPGVLVLNRDPEEGGAKPSNVTRALKAAGMGLALGGPQTRVTSADLKPYAAVVLENMALSDLNDRADGALLNYVRETGGGLLITGGRRSFAEGGYYQSRLEEALPVSLMRQEKYKRAKVALCLVLDRSGSMSAPVGGNLTKMDLANRGAAEAIALLMPQDEVAVIPVDSNAHTVVGLTPMEGNQKEITEKVLSIESMGGGIFVYTGLKAAVAELMNSEAQTRHIALFADAADSEEPGDYENLVAKWVQAGGTISVIGLGTPADQDADFLKDLAFRGGGEVFFTRDPHALPRIFCQDAIRIARKTFLDEPTGARVSPEIVRIGRLGIQAFPDVLGYNMCFTKEDASQLITTTDENQAPLLSVWQYGLGRVAALTCEADGPFTGDLRAWPDYGPFFSSLANWLQRDRDDLALFGTIVRSGRTAVVKLEMDEAAARECTGARAVIIPPSEEEPKTLPLRWVAPRRMEATFPLKSDGVYHGMVLTREGKRVSLPPVVLPYSPEFEPRPPQAGVETLEAIARSTGGKRIRHVKDLVETPTGEYQAQESAAPVLAGLIILLLLCDIITRKHLWPHLLPRFARTGLAKTKEGMVRAARGMSKVFRRKPKTVKPVEEVVPEEAAAESDEKKESVFDRAKRRSRDFN